MGQLGSRLVGDQGRLPRSRDRSCRGRADPGPPWAGRDVAGAARRVGRPPGRGSLGQSFGSDAVAFGAPDVLGSWAFIDPDAARMIEAVKSLPAMAFAPIVNLLSMSRPSTRDPGPDSDRLGYRRRAGKLGRPLMPAVAASRRRTRRWRPPPASRIRGSTGRWRPVAGASSPGVFPTEVFGTGHGLTPGLEETGPTQQGSSGGKTGFTVRLPIRGPTAPAVRMTRDPAPAAQCGRRGPGSNEGG